MAGKNKKAEDMLSLLRGQSESTDAFVDPYVIAMIRIGLKQSDQALSELNRAIEINSGWLPWLAVEPKFRPLHDRPEFKKLLERVGLRNSNK